MSKQLEFNVLEAITVAVLVEKELRLLEKDLTRATEQGESVRHRNYLEREMKTLETALAKLDTVYTLYVKED